eukprot:5589856-Prymnesium_polylepis.1
MFRRAVLLFVLLLLAGVFGHLHAGSTLEEIFAHVFTHQLRRPPPHESIFERLAGAARNLGLQTGEALLAAWRSGTGDDSHWVAFGH